MSNATKAIPDPPSDQKPQPVKVPPLQPPPGPVAFGLLPTTHPSKGDAYNIALRDQYG